MNFRQVRQTVPQNLAQGHHAPRRRIRSVGGGLFAGQVERCRHGAGIHVDQQGALEEQGVAVEEPAGTAYLAALHLDIVARPVFGGHPEAGEAVGRRLTDHLGQCAEPVNA